MQSSKIIENNFGKIPVIIERSSSEKVLPELEQTKYLFPEDFTFLDFSQVMRKKLHLGEHQTVSFFFENKKLYHSGRLLKEIYQENKDKDGFLYCLYAFENTTG